MQCCSFGCTLKSDARVASTRIVKRLGAGTVSERLAEHGAQDHGFEVHRPQQARAGKGGWYVHCTHEGITHVRFERTEHDRDETYRALFATFNVEPLIVEVAQ